MGRINSDISITDYLSDHGTTAAHTDFIIRQAHTREELRAYHQLRHEVFVQQQQLFSEHDHDATDDHPQLITLLAFNKANTLLGGVRVSPTIYHDNSTDLGWWTGSRLVTCPLAKNYHGLVPTLIRTACETVVQHGGLRFDAYVQKPYLSLFHYTGWQICQEVTMHGIEHYCMTWPINRAQQLLSSTKTFLGHLLHPFTTHIQGLGGSRFYGDDAVPIPQSSLIAACDAILPTIIDDDPYWAGWCSVLVNINDLTSMGAQPVGLLDAISGSTVQQLQHIVQGIADAAKAWNIPVLGGHTQLGTSPHIAVTALGYTKTPLINTARPGDVLYLTADIAGNWRSGYSGSQWDSTSHRSPEHLQAMTKIIAHSNAVAAKDVSMAGIIGTAAMLAESSHTGAQLEVASIIRPQQTTMGDWLTCFPGYAMLSAHRENPPNDWDVIPAVSTPCGILTDQPTVTLLWPDGYTTVAASMPATGIGSSHENPINAYKCL